MIKLIYLGIVVAVLLPCVFAAVASLQITHMENQIQREEQSRGSSAFFVRKETTIGLGRFGVSIYPRPWAAILVFTGLLLSMIGFVYLFFVRL